MKVIYLTILAVFIFLNRGCSVSEYKLENKYISRTISVGGHLKTVSIENKSVGKILFPLCDEEFRLRISKGSQVSDRDITLISADFKVISVEKYGDNGVSGIAVDLENSKHHILLTVHYELSDNDFYMRKFIEIKPGEDITLERIDVEVTGFEDIYQPYKIKQITARGAAKWRPGLGQPLYTSQSATFWGVEFPASYNYVVDKKGYCGYLWGRKIKKGSVYTSYKAVVGAGDEHELIQDAFFRYINRIRIRPLRLQVQYNTWFDYGHNVDKIKFCQSVSKINNELVKKRGVPPLSAYVIDDGWQDVNADWSDKTWKVNNKFDKDFSYSLSCVRNANSNLGLWLSPGCLFGAQKAAQRYKKQGFEVLDKWMSMAGPKYMQLFEDRILELTKEGVTYFKLDGIFGHLNTREFELKGQRYGLPYMPQLGTDTLSPSDIRLNNHKFDELKTYYLVAGTERLMQIFKKQNEINHNVYVVISNGAYLSPWWLMYVDAVWMINAGDAARGSNRTEEMVYRDGVYYDTWVKEKTQFPINSVFNHEPKKISSGESKQQFTEYLLMNLSRGTGFVELYIKTDLLSSDDWDVLAEGLKWVHKVFPYFKHSRMHGGNPKNKEVYGYTAWNKTGGYISFHNPSGKEVVYNIILDKKTGVFKSNNKYVVSSPFKTDEDLIGESVRYGDTLKISLKPYQVKVLNFDMSRN